MANAKVKVFLGRWGIFMVEGGMVSLGGIGRFFTARGWEVSEWATWGGKGGV